MVKKYSDEVKDRAVRMLLEHQGSYTSITVTSSAVGLCSGIPHKTLRGWVEQDRIDEGRKSGTKTTNSDEARAPREEVGRLGAADEILRSAGQWRVQ